MISKSWGFEPPLTKFRGRVATPKPPPPPLFDAHAPSSIRQSHISQQKMQQNERSFGNAIVYSCICIRDKHIPHGTKVSYPLSAQQPKGALNKKYPWILNFFRGVGALIHGKASCLIALLTYAGFAEGGPTSF